MMIDLTSISWEREVIDVQGKGSFGPIPFTISTLPNPATLAEGTSVYVSDYGKNIATVLNGMWRFKFPFRTTWVGRPDVGLVPAGTELQVTDYNNQKFISDGTYWRPAQGRVLLKSIFGLSAAGGQIAQISGTTAGLFAVPGGCKIPVGMITPHSRIYVQFDGYKTGANATANSVVYIGSTNSASDASVVNQTISIGTGTNFLSSCAARFGTATDKFNSRTWQGDGVTYASNNSLSDRTGNVNTNADMYVNVGVASANSNDVFNLVAFQVAMEA